MIYRSKKGEGDERSLKKWAEISKPLYLPPLASWVGAIRLVV
jgi:hypothetical protein